ncbi:hypothetical protein ABEW34_01320 [Paenibacillus algorifonticola]|uniref:hypothetical protein n=1 Tax=Paenibacillus algorifonticola TaxID=684063 RepID=UPI003D2A6E46
MSEGFQEYEQLVHDEDKLALRLETYQEAISELLMLIHKRASNGLDIQTIEEIIMNIHSVELVIHTQLLKVKFEKSILSNEISKR